MNQSLKQPAHGLDRGLSICPSSKQHMSSSTHYSLLRVGSGDRLRPFPSSSLPKSESGERIWNKFQQCPLPRQSNNVSPFCSPFSSKSSLQDLTVNSREGSGITCSRSSNTSLHSHHHSKQQALLVNRSGKEAVKGHLAFINNVCEKQEERNIAGAPALNPPFENCTALSFWSTDAYYAIVMYKNGGIATIIRAMEAFLDISDSDVEDFVPFENGRRKHKVHSNASRFQACCSRTLLGLCQTSERLKESIVAAGGRNIVLAAMQRHPRSFDPEAFADLLQDKN